MSNYMHVLEVKKKAMKHVSREFEVSIGGQLKAGAGGCGDMAEGCGDVDGGWEGKTGEGGGIDNKNLHTKNRKNQ